MSGACSLHSRHQKSMSFILYKRVIYTYTIIQHRNREGKKPLWGGRKRRRRRRRRGGGLSGGEGGGRLLTARNLIFKTCNLQSNDAILIINVLVLDSVIGIKAK